MARSKTTRMKGITKLKEQTRDTIVRLNKERKLTQKEIRDITGIPERTQRRIIADPNHRVRIFTARKADKVGQVQELLGIDLLKIKEKYAIADIVQKKTESRFFEIYRVKKVKKITKAIDKDYFEIPLTLQEFQQMNLATLKKLVKGEIYYVRVFGEHKIRGGKHGREAFQYSSGAFHRPDKTDLKAMKEYLNELRNTASSKYTGTEILGISLTTVEFKASKKQL
jgi:hypothetical protein